MLKAGKNGLGVSKVVGAASFGSPAPGHAHSDHQTCFFPASALEEIETPLRCGLIHVVSVKSSVEWLAN